MVAVRGFSNLVTMHKIFSMAVAVVYPLYLTKIEKKGRTQAELNAVILWLTGFDDKSLTEQLNDGRTFREFFDAATLNPLVHQITGSICGVKIDEIEDPLMKKIRYLDKLVDELAKGRPLEKVLRH